MNAKIIKINHRKTFVKCKVRILLEIVPFNKILLTTGNNKIHFIYVYMYMYVVTSAQNMGSFLQL